MGLYQLWCMRMGGLVSGIHGRHNELMSVMVYGIKMESLVPGI